MIKARASNRSTRESGRKARPISNPYSISVVAMTRAGGFAGDECGLADKLSASTRPLLQANLAVELHIDIKPLDRKGHVGRKRFGARYRAVSDRFGDRMLD